MSRGKQASPKTGWRAAPRTVWALGVVSLLMDVSSEMIHGLLPVFLVAGDTVWRDATGHGLGVELRANPQALLGHEAAGVGGPFSVVMLSMMEAVERVATPREIPAHLLLEQWQDTTERLAQDASPGLTGVQGPRAASPGSRP